MRKLLLLYLFITFCFGLVFNGNAKSSEYICFKDYNGTQAQVYKANHGKSEFYDLCISKKKHFYTWYELWHFRNDTFISKEKINHAIGSNNNFNKKRIKFSFNINQDENTNVEKTEPKKVDECWDGIYRWNGVVVSKILIV